MGHRPARLLSALAALAGAACTRTAPLPGGTTSGPGCNPPGAFTPAPAPTGCGEVVDPGPAPLRSLPASALRNTVAAAFPAVPVPPLTLPPTRSVGGFSNNAAANAASPRSTEALQAWARDTGQKLGFLGTPPCSGEGAEEAACMGPVVERVLTDLQGRPPADAEVKRDLDLYLSLRRTADPALSRAGLFEAMLLSPRTGYLLERTLPGDGPFLPLDGWSLARRLAAFLADGPPDETLRAAARDGRLATSADVEREARRLLTLPGARRTVRAFHEQWLDLARTRAVSKGSLGPGFGEEIREALIEETLRFSEWAVFDGGGRLETLLTSNHTFVNDRLLPFYGLPLRPTGGWQPVDLEASHRAGVLTHPSFLAGHATLENPSPVLRGVWIRERLFCLPTGLPPPDADTSVAHDPANASTNRERYAAGTERGSCVSCHGPVNHLGYGFENFDALGRWRDTDAGRPVDASATAAGTDVAGCFEKPDAFVRALAKSARAEECYATMWFRYALGRVEEPTDACTLDRLEKRFHAAGGDVRELLIAIAASDAFRYRRREAP